MASPVINTIVAPATVAPGETFAVLIDASDPDTLSGVLTGLVTDAAGNQAQATVTIQVQDVLTYNLTAPAGWTVAPGATPNEFLVTAP